jgi:hypothetical protein
MKKSATILFFLLLAGTCTAQAQFHIEGLLGYGFKDGWKFGYGARAGFDLGKIIYLGGVYVAHTGIEETISINQAPTTFEANVSYYGAEVGLPLSGLITLRPSLIIGAANVKAEYAAYKADETKFMVAPGLSAYFELGPLYLGGDGRLVIVGKDDSIDYENVENPSGTLFALYAIVGVKL